MRQRTENRAEAAYLDRSHRGSVITQATDMNPVTSILVFVCLLAGAGNSYYADPDLVLFVLAGALIAGSLKMANVRQKSVVLRRWRKRRIRGPWCLHDGLRTAAAPREPLHGLRAWAAGVSWLVGGARLLILGSTTRIRCAP